MVSEEKSTLFNDNIIVMNKGKNIFLSIKDYRSKIMKKEFFQEFLPCLCAHKSLKSPKIN